jgi:hypothetical protein
MEAFGKPAEEIGNRSGRPQRVFLTTAVLAAVLALLSSMALAQTGFSALRGNVTDTSGAVVPGAKIVLTEPATGTQRSTTSDSQGNFEFPNLKPGTYQLNSEMAGFKAFTAMDVQLDAGQVRRLDIQLTVGATQERIEVRAGAAAITTEGGTISNTVEIRKNADIPLIETYPSPYSLFATMPMVQGRDWGINIAGQNEDQMSIQINGMSNDRAGEQNNNLRFVEEATVTTVNATADSSRVVSYNLTTKRGANAWHGAVFYQHYNSALNATPHPEPKKNAYIQHDWQAEIGGPIWKDHTFVYASWFRNRSPLGSYHTATVPTDAMWNGNLSGVAGISTITDPETGQPFPNNTIPADRISQVATALKSFYPQPNIGDPNVYADNNFGWQHRFTSPLNYVGNWPYFRLDHNISSKNTIFASWMQRLTPFVGAGSIPSIPWTRNRDNRQLTVADTHTFSPRVLNTLRFGYSDDVISDAVDLGGLDLPKGGDMTAALGIEGVNPSGINAPGGPTFSTDDSIIGFTPSAKWSNKAKTFSVEESLSYQVGRHLWKFGGDFSAYRSTTENAPNYGSFSFNGMFTGSPFADFLLGLPSTSSRSDPLVARTIVAKEIGFYVTDTFKLTPRLTLDYGLRWDYYSLPTYTDGLIYNFDMATGQVIVPQSKLAQANPAFTAVPVVAGQAVPDADMGNFRPRISASYLIGNGFVIRGGYGQFTERFGHDYTAQAGNQGAGPFERLSETFLNTNTGGQPLFTFPNPFPSGVGEESAPGNWVVALPKHWDNGTIHQFNVSLEKEIASIGLRASYVGSRSRGLNYMWWYNENILGPSSTPYEDRIAAGEQLPFPTLSQVYPYHHDGAANYDALQVEGSRKKGWFFFDAHYTFAKNRNNIERADDILNPTKIWGPEINLRDQMLTFTTRWELPFGKGRAHLNHLPGVVDGFLGGWAIQTISSFGSGTHLTPFIYGLSDFANNNWNTWIPDVIPGANPNLPGDQRTQQRYFNTPVLNGDGTDYVQLGAFKVPGCPDNDPLCLFSTPENIGRLGNAKPGTVDGPGLNVHHLSLAKSFPVTERIRTTFVTEISNLFNHPHFWYGDNWDPGTWIQDAGAGKLTWALPDNDPFKGGHRLISFKLRIEF